MDYEKEILRILMKAGSDGLSVQKVSRHVFNCSNTFFHAANFEEIHAYVERFLNVRSKTPMSVIERGERRGCYRLNLQSKETQQLMLQFTDAVEQEKPAEETDLSLSLF